MGNRKCVICTNDSLENSVVCSDDCQKVRLQIFSLTDKYTPTHGCDNCWGDLGIGCSTKCRQEFKAMGKFSTDMWSLVHLITKHNKEIPDAE